MSRLTAILPLLLLSTAWAGCLESPVDSPATVDAAPETATSTVLGLLVDDRFRPLADGRLFLVELGMDTRSDGNGEFTFAGLPLGTYTLKAVVADHEAAPLTLTLEESVMQVSMVARRLANTDGVIITEELAAFVGCNINTPPAALYCGEAVVPDASGDSQRWQLDLDYQQHGATAMHWVVEMQTDKDAERNGAVKLIVRSRGSYFVNDVVTEGRYLWTVMTQGEESPNDVEERNHKWHNDRTYRVQVWAQGLYKEETQAFPAGAIGDYDSRGIGAQLGLKANLVSSLFLFESDVPLTASTYCTLC